MVTMAPSNRVQVRRCELTLHDYLFYATTERGKVAETGAFLHNWSLTYALGWASGPWRAETQAPHYRDELLQAFERTRAYVTPGRLLTGGYRLVQYNTLPDTYALPKTRGVGYPEWGFMKCLRPGARFRFYVLSADDAPLPRFVRLGKLMAKAEIGTAEARAVRTVRGPFETDALLNWADLVDKPVTFDLLANSLPSRLVDHAMFEEAEGLRAEFDGGSAVTVPVRMGYFGQGRCDFS